MKNLIFYLLFTLSLKADGCIKFGDYLNTNTNVSYTLVSTLNNFDTGELVITLKNKNTQKEVTYSLSEFNKLVNDGVLKHYQSKMSFAS